MKTSHVLLLAIIICGGLEGCGKSRKQIEEEYAKQAIKAQAEAAAASAAEARLIEAEQQRADAEQTRQNGLKIADLQAKAAQSLKDPSSAQFRNVHMSTNGSGICGQMNAKNSFGGYVGFKDFFANDKGLFIKPSGCGTVPLSNMIERSMDEAGACITYASAVGTNNECK